MTSWLIHFVGFFFATRSRQPPWVNIPCTKLLNDCGVMGGFLVGKCVISGNQTLEIFILTRAKKKKKSQFLKNENRHQSKTSKTVETGKPPKLQFLVFTHVVNA